jgi:hypothetical protein
MNGVLSHNGQFARILFTTGDDVMTPVKPVRQEFGSNSGKPAQSG